MNAVLSAEVARQITKGRKPLVPIEYEAAVKALEACINLDETKIWADKSDALAAWAKIYHDGKVLRQAKCLKMRAFRRMYELAKEVNPRRSTAGVGGRGSLLGSGHRTELKKLGLTVCEVDAARLLGQLPARKFEKLLENPRAPATYRSILRDDREGAWSKVQRALMHTRSTMRATNPKDLELTTVEKFHARQLVKEMTDWLDEFDLHLEKAA